MIDEDVLSEFETWFLKDIDGDPDFEGATAMQAIQWATERRCLDNMLLLPSSGMSFREFYYRRENPEPSPFPTVRRIGGDQDRGFSPALNDEMRKRQSGGSDSN